MAHGCVLRKALCILLKAMLSRAFDDPGPLRAPGGSLGP